MNRLVIVGASLAGLRAAEAARAAGHEGELVLIGDERHRPYTRPPLSKAMLAGAASIEECLLPASDSLDAEWRLGVAAVDLDREAKIVRLADGDAVAYDCLLVASGCRARPWPGDGGGLAGVHTIRSLDDAVALGADLDRGPQVAIIGAGFLGCEVAATARGQGLSVTLIDISPTPMAIFGPEVGSRSQALHRDRGVDVRCGVGVRRFCGKAQVEGIELTDGSLIAAQVVVVALGAQPNTEWLEASGLVKGGGVACDTTLTTQDDDDVLAAGDVASWPYPAADHELIRCEHWVTAADQGRLAGSNAVLERDKRVAFSALPYAWSDQYDVKIQALGLPGLAEETTVLEASPEGGGLIVAGMRQDRVVSIVAFNLPRRLPSYRRHLPGAPSLAELRDLVGIEAAAIVATAAS
jgi:3-phenylpropionate/trans-cinnamate dioxygenase ferredoxin reductase component